LWRFVANAALEGADQAGRIARDDLLELLSKRARPVVAIRRRIELAVLFRDELSER